MFFILLKIIQLFLAFLEQDDLGISILPYCWRWYTFILLLSRDRGKSQGLTLYHCPNYPIEETDLPTFIVSWSLKSVIICAFTQYFQLFSFHAQSRISCHQFKVRFSHEALFGCWNVNESEMCLFCPENLETVSDWMHTTPPAAQVKHRSQFQLVHSRPSEGFWWPETVCPHCCIRN